MPPAAKRPDGALPGSRIVTGTRDIARAWLAEPTTRYDHGILGDKIEAGALVIESRDGKRHTVQLNDDAVFEDLEPRLADLDGDGRDEIIVVKSYLKRGSSLAVIAERKGRYEIVAETPPLGQPHRWLNPAGIADFNGDGKTDIALVRMPHVLGILELWSWRNGRLRKSAELPDAANHVAGTRAQHERRRRFRRRRHRGSRRALARPQPAAHHLVCAQRQPHEIASVALPAKAVTNIGLVAGAGSRSAGDRGRPRRWLAGRDPKSSVNRQIFQQRQYADDDDDDAHDLFGAAIDRQHVDEVKHQDDDKKRDQKADDKGPWPPLALMPRRVVVPQ